MEICQYILINMVSQNLPHRNFVNTHINPRIWYPIIYHMEICQYILINMVSQNFPHGNLSININKYVSQNLPHGNLSIHINKYGIPEFTTWKFD